MLELVESGDLTLRRGDRDESTQGAVTEMQQFLEREGFSLPDYGVDGIFETETQSAVNAFRASKDLPATGVFDSQAMGDSGAHGGVMNWLRRQVERTVQQEPDVSMPAGAGGSFAGIDLGSLSRETGIEPAFLMAILQQESAGNPSAIRFEPHLFNRKSKNGKVPFTAAEGKTFSLTSSETNKGAFERAYNIDADAAVRSTSWGLGQVLGGHLINLYGGPERGIEAFWGNPRKVSLELIVEWIKANPRAVSAAKNKDFANFARIYNGRNYKMNNYDVKLEQGYNAALAELA
jgi:peptidoglycan hydrolase-like protein with peptidoglycan-binding domain